MKLTVGQLRRIIKEEVARVAADVPADYEVCDTCGYDHEYEHAEAQAAHEKLGNTNDGTGR